MPELTIAQAIEVALEHHRAGRLPEAVAIYQRVLALQPDHTDAIHLLGVVALQGGHHAQALELFDRAVALDGKAAIYHSNRGQALQALGRKSEAIAAYRRAIELDPNYVDARNNLGTALESTIQLEEAAKSYAAALRLKPDSGEVLSNLGNVLKDQGQIAPAIAYQRRAIELRPDVSLMHSNLLLALHYLPDISGAELAAEHRAWSKRHADPLRHKRLPSTRPRDPARRLRIGYVSPDFREHAVARFIAPLVAAHDRTQVEVVCYADNVHGDEVTVEFEKMSDLWRDIARLNDDRFAALVREDQVDILFDLAGHTSRGRLRAFALKPAPVQVSYLGYPNSTGLDAIDYRLVDAWTDPPGLNDAHYIEKLWRLPTTAWCYRPPADAPEPAESPRLARGEFHFGSFNTLAKMSPMVVALWAEVLRAIPHAKLVLKAKALADHASQRAVTVQFARLGIEAARLEFLPWAKTTAEHLAQYSEVDVALDSFPYHGTTTTCDALWMGVPVVSLAGQLHHSRVGISLLHNAGLADCIASSPAEYVRIATELAAAPEKLSERRRGLRAQVAASPLRDEAQFARDVEAALRGMWRTHCASPGP